MQRLPRVIPFIFGLTIGDVQGRPYGEYERAPWSVSQSCPSAAAGVLGCVIGGVGVGLESKFDFR